MNFCLYFLYTFSQFWLSMQNDSPLCEVFSKKKILLYNKIIQQYLRALFDIFSSNSKLLFFLDYYYTQELHVFLKILLFLFFQLMIVVEIGLGMYYPNTQNPNLTRIWVDEYANSTWTRNFGKTRLLLNKDLSLKCSRRCDCDDPKDKLSRLTMSKKSKEKCNYRFVN